MVNIINKLIAIIKYELKEAGKSAGYAMKR